MRARYYNPDIKRFINQDIKVGDIGNSQSLNRYAYCEGNPVSLVDPFGLSPQAAWDSGEESKYAFWHNVLDVAGLFFDGADIINAALYAKEGDWGNAALCAASAIPAIGAAIAGVAKSVKAVVKVKKAAEIASLAAEASRMTKKAADTLDTLSDTMRVAEKYGKSAIKSADNILGDVGTKVAKALETGGDFGKEAGKAMKSADAAGDLRLSTKVDDAADALKAGDSYVAKSLDEYGAAVKGDKGTEIYYRTMSQADYDYLRMTGELPSTGETFISPTKSFSSNYNGVMVRFELNNGTTSMLEEIGLSNGDRAILAKEIYPNMPYVSGVKWTENFAFFKAEASQINIGLGKGKALEIFNSNINTFRKVEY